MALNLLELQGLRFGKNHSHQAGIENVFKRATPKEYSSWNNAMFVLGQHGPNLITFRPQNCHGKNHEKLQVVKFIFYIETTLPATNSLHLKIDGWNTILSFWDGLFSGANC